MQKRSDSGMLGKMGPLLWLGSPLHAKGHKPQIVVKD